MKNNQPIENTAGLKKLLEKLGKNKDEIFRGHSSAKHKLEPNALRKKTLDKNRKLITDARKAKLTKLIKNNPKYINLNAQIMYRKYDLPEESVLDTPHIGVSYNNILDLIIDKSAHLHSLKEYENGLPKNKAKLLNNKSKKMDFLSIDNLYRYFLYMIQFVHQKWDLKTNKPITPDVKHANPATYDETWAQHYGFPTAALDWTRNPLIALYFATSEHWEKENTTEQIQIVSEYKTYCSIYSYKQISKENNIPVQIEEAKENNERAKRQEGCFTCMKEIDKFYLTNKRYPTLKDYDNYNKIFILKEYKIKCLNEIIEYSKNLLLKKGYNKKYFLLTN